MREVPDRIERLPDHYFTALLAQVASWARLSLAVRDEILDRGLERLRAAFA
jgi:hypothetical protein